MFLVWTGARKCWRLRLLWAKCEQCLFQWVLNPPVWVEWIKMVLGNHENVKLHIASLWELPTQTDSQWLACTGPIVVILQIPAISEHCHHFHSQWNRLKSSWLSCFHILNQTWLCGSFTAKADVVKWENMNELIIMTVSHSFISYIVRFKGMYEQYIRVRSCKSDPSSIRRVIIALLQHCEAEIFESNWILFRGHHVYGLNHSLCGWSRVCRAVCDTMHTMWSIELIPPEAFDWLCWTGSDAITLASFPVIFKSLSARMVWPIGKSLFFRACRFFRFDLECLCECVSVWACSCAMWCDWWRRVRVAVLWRFNPPICRLPARNVSPPQPQWSVEREKKSHFALSH